MARLDQSQEPSEPWTEPNRRFQLTLPSFAAPEFEARAIQCVANLPDDVHLTIDVRRNAGGNTPCDLVAALMPMPYRFWRHATLVQSGLERTEGVPSRMQITEPARIEPTTGAFRGPMTILIDRGTFSAAEDFVLPFKDNGRAWIVGEATGGSSG